MCKGKLTTADLRLWCAIKTLTCVSRRDDLLVRNRELPIGRQASTILRHEVVFTHRQLLMRKSLFTFADRRERSANSICFCRSTSLICWNNLHLRIVKGDRKKYICIYRSKVLVCKPKLLLRIVTKDPQTQIFLADQRVRSAANICSCRSESLMCN